MNKTTSIQRITIAMLLGYLFWEIGVWFWAKNLPPSDPVMRVDLILIYPFLTLFISISLYQYFNKAKNNN